ncbi:C4-dicarboxylate ABC transporter [Campylobacter sp. MIT 12-5580]|uniref:anaerobic C4-dicarboxylate transporter n=1 Tax=Campylobacter sp. MIT 12-5580 TaxID=2040651 RepID=UPI0010F77E0E|nr:anaerobic C4-dicarboxylate transporter [Campylobacter sp. MIT 12-5580]TKX28146.1 C4-dicarboxylate ABC transporter [Campylobacter sp. MIT 12-5580]
MDILLILQIIVLLGAIFLGVRLGGIGIGFAGGLGVVVLTLILGMKVGNIPWDVILIIMSVIAAISAMQLAGGLDYLVQVAEKILRSNPKYINYLAPTVTYVLTLLAGTGHTAFSMIPVIVEVAKEQNIKPSAPLSIAVVSSQIAITASPVSAAVVYMTGVLEPLGWSYPLLLGIWIPTTFVGCMLTAFIISKITDLDLSKDEVYQERLKNGLIKASTGAIHTEVKPGAKLSVLIFLLGVLCVVFYATTISDVVRKPMLDYVNMLIAEGSSLSALAEFVKSYIDPVRLPRDGAIMSFMLSIAALIVIFCKINTAKIFEQSVFKSGMVACVCVLGVAWLGDTFVAGYKGQIQDIAGDLATKLPFLVAVAFFFASMLLYSQAATAKAIVPTIVAALSISATSDGSVAANSYILVASFAAVSALFVLPTYPTLLGAVQMDDTGSTRIGKYVFNHAFLIPGTLAIALSVALGFLVAPLF